MALVNIDTEQNYSRICSQIYFSCILLMHGRDYYNKDPIASYSIEFLAYKEFRKRYINNVADSTEQCIPYVPYHTVAFDNGKYEIGHIDGFAVGDYYRTVIRKKWREENNNYYIDFFFFNIKCAS
jgi:hypothetical protein